MKFNILILLLLLNGVSAISFCQSPDWNLDFEEWDLDDTTPDLWHDTTVIENRVGLFPPKWHYRPDHIPEGKGLGRTTDATHGEYAVALSGFYQYQVMRIISGDHPNKSGWPIDYRPDKLIGDYKAVLLGNCDSLKTYVDIFLTSYNNNTNKRDTIGQSNIVLDEATSYTPFELEIEYQNKSIIPDTVIIVLAEERFGFDHPPACLECSHVFFDNLELTTITSNTKLSLPKSQVSIFPNPTDNKLFIKSACADCLYDIALISLSGQVLINYYSIKDEIEINSHLIGKGLYFLKITDKNSRRYFFEKVIVE